ncbi:hypothetical protein [Caenimonas sp. SL110]|uniref:hypothetical protein n=1 Tax=Caenimonas sp. SL110 TaxID=1450524 RepID=UPI00069DFEE3|nr:hypothetical protein [Caenimonas sp. SL110]
MNSTPALSRPDRLSRLESLLQHDPDNELLLADTAEAAIAAAQFDRAGELIQAGLRLSGNPAAWQFRRATLCIAQRRLDEARDILAQLEASNGPHPAISHNLAYVEFLRGNHAACAALLKPLLADEDTALAGAEPAAHALWLRAMHHTGALQEAWDWSIARISSGKLGPQACGVASLIALDLSRIDDAARLSQRALDAGVNQVEPFVARAGAALAAQDTALARQLLQQALALSPGDGRTWSSLGFAALLDRQFDEARGALENALGTMGEHVETLQALGWACVMCEDLGAAAAALDKAISLDGASAQAHGARAVVHALADEGDQARAAVLRAFALDASCVTARFAQELLAGHQEGVRELTQFATTGGRRTIH